MLWGLPVADCFNYHFDNCKEFGWGLAQPNMWYSCKLSWIYVCTQLHNMLDEISDKFNVAPTQTTNVWLYMNHVFTLL